MNKRSAAKQAAFAGILAAVALVLSVVEGWIPPLPFLPPGAKAGFSNIAVMFAAQFFGGPTALAIALMKSLFALITRGGVAGLMSLAGGIGSTLVMWACVRKNASFLLTGILGAVTHNSLQLAVAILLTDTWLLATYFPALLLFAVCAGTVTGFLLKILYPPLCRVAQKFR